MSISANTLIRSVVTTLVVVLTGMGVASQAHAAQTAKVVKESSPMAGASVIGGYYPSTAEWPWMAALLDSTRGSDDFHQQFCGGALVHPRLVVTAAHCVHGKQAGKLAVLLGKRRLSGAGGEHIGVQEVSLHPGYVPSTGSRAPDSDVALLYLSAPSSRPTAPLLPQGTTLYQGNLITTMGWGRRFSGTNYDYDEQKSDDLKAIDQALWSATNCRAAGRSAVDRAFYAAMNTTTQVCAGYTDIVDTTCHGDSGSPTMIKDTAGQWRLAGVVSWGSLGCEGSYSPTVYAWLGGSLQTFVSQGISRAATLTGPSVVPSTPPARPARPRIRLRAGLKRLSVRRGRPLAINVISSAKGNLRIAVMRRKRSGGTFEAPVRRGRSRVLQPTRIGRRKFARGSYRLRLQVRGAGARSNVISLGFRIR